MLGFKYEKSVSEGKIEEAARGFGMHLEGECKSFFKEDKAND